MHHQQGARWREGKREDVLERAFELRALGKVAERFVKFLVEPEVVHERLQARLPDHLVQLEAELPERIELVVVLEPLRGETRGRALEHPRSSIASSMSVRVNSRTTNPPPGSASRSPSCSTVISAIRSGVLDTPSSSTRRSSGTRSRGLKAPLSSSSRSPSVAFVVCEFSWFPRGTVSGVTAAAEFHAARRASSSASSTKAAMSRSTGSGASR